MHVEDQVLDFINDVKQNPYHIRENDHGAPDFTKIIKLDDQIYLKLVYNGYYDHLPIGYEDRGKWAPEILFSLYVLEEKDNIESFSTLIDENKNFGFSIKAIEEYVKVMKNVPTITEDHLDVILNEGSIYTTYLRFYPNEENILLCEYDGDEEQFKVVKLKKTLQDKLLLCFEILNNFNFFLDELPENP
jgi:hypothetical protein